MPGSHVMELLQKSRALGALSWIWRQLRFDIELALRRLATLNPPTTPNLNPPPKTQSSLHMGQFSKLGFLFLGPSPSVGFEKKGP